MSATSELIRAALYEKLNVAGVTALATGGVWYKVAPTKTVSGQGQVISVAFPFVIFDRIPGAVDYAFASNIVGERDLWTIRAVADDDSATDKSPAQLTQQILDACETAINGSLSVSGRVVSCARRRGDMPAMVSDQSDRQVWQLGFYLDVYAG